MKKKVIIVTGSGSGLGKAIYDTLKQNGVDAYGDIDVFPVDLSAGMNVSYPADIASMIINNGQEVVGVINCAGINHNEWFEDVTFDSMIKVMEVNAFSFIWMTQTFLEDLKANKGFVINIVSNAAHIPMTSSLAYNASKAAGLMITKQMAHELTPKHGITVFSISPNKLRGTGMSKQIEDNVCKTRGWTPEFAAEYQKKALMHGLETEPQAIANFIRHRLVTGDWRFMSGTDIPFGK